METSARRTDNSLTPYTYTIEEKLFAEPYEFDFYQIIRILSSLRKSELLPEQEEEASLDPISSEQPLSDYTSFGKGVHIRTEPACIKSSISYSVHRSDVQSLSRHFLPDHPPILTVNFLGVAGIQGPLPQPYTELLSNRLQEKDFAFRDFLDIFNHRFVSFWYLVEKKHIPGLEQVPPDTTDIGKTILDIAGFSQPILLEHLHLDTRSLLNYAPLFWQRQRSIAGLHKIIKGYFGTEVIIQEFFGAWRTPPKEDWSLLGSQKGRYQKLGISFIVGKRSWDASAGICLTLVDLPWSTYLKHLPGTPGNEALHDLCRLYSGLGFILDLKAILKKEEIPPAILGEELYLGQTSWITRGHGLGFKRNPHVRLLREQG